jgi:hypothetical protein
MTPPPSGPGQGGGGDGGGGDGVGEPDGGLARALVAEPALATAMPPLIRCDARGVKAWIHLRQVAKRAGRAGTLHRLGHRPPPRAARLGLRRP